MTFGIARRASNLVPRGVLPTAAGEWGRAGAAGRAKGCLPLLLAGKVGRD